MGLMRAVARGLGDAERSWEGWRDCGGNWELFGRTLRPVRVKRLAAFEHSIDLAQQFAHGGHHDVFAGAPFVLQTLAQGPDIGVTAQRRQGGHVEGSSTAPGAHFAQTGRSMDALAAGLVLGIQSEEGDGLIGARDFVDGWQFGDHGSGGDQGHTRNRIGQSDLSLELGRLLQKAFDGLIQTLDFLFQVLDLPLEALAGQARSGFQQVGKTIAVLDEALAGTGQILELAVVRCQGFPEGELLPVRRAEVGDQAGVDPVVDGAGKPTVGIVACASGIDQARLVALEVEPGCQAIAIAAGRLQTGVQRGGLADALALEPGLQHFEAFGVVHEGGAVARLGIHEGSQMHIELVFGDIYTKNMSRCIHSELWM